MSGLLLLLFLLFFFFFFFITLPAESNNSTYPSCPSSNCGTVNISYPFWRVDGESTTQFCGYQGFGINCSNISQQNISNITLGGEPYYVKEINYVYGNIFLADYYEASPVARVSNNCPRVRHSITLGTLPLDFVMSSVNLSIRSGCNGCPSYATEIQCLEPSVRKVCLEIMNTSRDESEWDEHLCDQEVVTTVFEEIINEFNLATNLSSVLERGFGLRWGQQMDECKKCEESGGRCGRQNPTGFICFCADDTTSRDDCKGSKINFRLKLVTGVVSATILFVVTFKIYCILKPPSSNCVTSLKHKTEDEKNIEAFVMHYGSLSTKRYTYSDIKKMTNSFKVKLGQGGFGQVFKGKLSDGRLVAVKLLTSSKANGQ